MVWIQNQQEKEKRRSITSSVLDWFGLCHMFEISFFSILPGQYFDNINSDVYKKKTAFWQTLTGVRLHKTTYVFQNDTPAFPPPVWVFLPSPHSYRQACFFFFVFFYAVCCTKFFKKPSALCKEKTLFGGGETKGDEGGGGGLVQWYGPAVLNPDL